MKCRLLYFISLYTFLGNVAIVIITEAFLLPIFPHQVFPHKARIFKCRVCKRHKKLDWRPNSIPEALLGVSYLMGASQVYDEPPKGNLRKFLVVLFWQCCTCCNKQSVPLCGDYAEDNYVINSNSISYVIFFYRKNDENIQFLHCVKNQQVQYFVGFCWVTYWTAWYQLLNKVQLQSTMYSETKISRGLSTFKKLYL